MTIMATAPEVSPATVRKAVFASAIGNATEWYDYGVFTSGAIATAIGTVFFPGGSGSAVLKSLALVAVGFIVRPFGSVFFGPLGDKIGRREVLAVTILMMSGCTFLVGLMPTFAVAGYGAVAGLLLLRLIQGFSTGGEYGGA
ncbi:MAG: MFS transporter, partial [Pseudonocardia sp.]|nr:MFS transporter [Pseudonocardia sp.]